MSDRALDLDAIEQYARDAGPGTIQSAAAAHMLRRSVPNLVAAVRELQREVGERDERIQAAEAIGWYGPLDDPAPAAYVNGWNDCARQFRRVLAGSTSNQEDDGE